MKSSNNGLRSNSIQPVNGTNSANLRNKIIIYLKNELKRLTNKNKKITFARRRPGPVSVERQRSSEVHCT